jgi:hypothetical protein
VIMTSRQVAFHNQQGSYFCLTPIILQEKNQEYVEQVPVMTLILNKYRQSSNSSVLAFKFKVQRQLRMPIARYCLSVKLVQVRSNVDS